MFPHPLLLSVTTATPYPSDSPCSWQKRPNQGEKQGREEGEESPTGIDWRGLDKLDDSELKLLLFSRWSESEVAQSCPTVCDPMDCSLSGSFIHDIFQARVLERVAISFSRDVPNPGIKPRSLELQADALPSELPGKLIHLK